MRKKLRNKFWDIRMAKLLKKIRNAGILCIERDGRYYLPAIGMNIHVQNTLIPKIVIVRPWGIPGRFFHTWNQFLKYYEENKVR